MQLMMGLILGNRGSGVGGANHLTEEQFGPWLVVVSVTMGCIAIYLTLKHQQPKWRGTQRRVRAYT